MAIQIPEILLFNIIQSCFDAIKDDWNRHLDEKDTLLYAYFGNLPVHGKKWNWFEQAKDLFLREEDHPRKIEVEMFFNSERARAPTVHLTLPSEQSSGDGIGVDIGYQEDRWDDSNLTYQQTSTRMFESQYHILISSDNTLEVQLIYNFLRGMIISIFTQVELAGLRNPKLSGQDLRLESHLVPEHIFVRGLGIRTEYEVSVPEYFSKDMVKNIILGTVTLIDNN